MMYTFRAGVALRERVLRFIQRRKVKIVGIRSLVRTITILLLGNICPLRLSSISEVVWRLLTRARAALLWRPYYIIALWRPCYIIADAKYPITANAKQTLIH